MENIPNQHEQELSYDDKVVLVKRVFEAVKVRNDFIDRQGGYDTYVETGKGTAFGGTGKEFDQLCEIFNQARANFDTQVINKEEFIQELRDAGEEQLAENVKLMFTTPEKISHGDGEKKGFREKLGSIFRKKN